MCSAHRLQHCAALALSAVWLSQPAGASLEIALGAADVVVVGAAGDRVRVSPIDPGDAASARAVSMTGDARVGVRLTGAPAAAASPRPKIRVEAPASLPLVVTLDNGEVRAEDMIGGASVRVVRGSIRAHALRGRVRLEIDTGPIVADAVRLSDGHSLKCRTFNGDVSIALEAPPADARILALTLNGAIRSSLPLATRAAFGPRFGEATLGAGAHVLSIDVVRGDIAIEQRGK
jgi:hypothetical protein